MLRHRNERQLGTRCVLFIAALTACNGSSGNPDSGQSSECNTLAQSLCQKATTCNRPDGSVQIIYSIGSTVHTDVFLDLNGCESFFSRGCRQQADGGFNAAACAAAVPTATCATSPDGLGLLVPECYGLH